MTKVAALRAKMGAFFAVEIHGEDATVEHAENVVYVRDDGNVVELEKMLKVMIDVFRTEEGWGDLSDDEVADRLIAKFDTGPEAEG